MSHKGIFFSFLVVTCGRRDATFVFFIFLWYFFIFLLLFSQWHAGASWRAADSQSSDLLVLESRRRQRMERGVRVCVCGGGVVRIVMDDLEKLSAVDLRNWTPLLAIREEEKKKQHAMKARQYGPSISLRKVGWPSRGLFRCGGSRADPWLISPNGDFICSYGEVASVNEDESGEVWRSRANYATHTGSLWS